MMSMRMTISVLALGVALCGMPAMAAPAIDVRLPVIAATLQSDQVDIRLPRGLGSRGLTGATRSITIEAFDADGKRVDQTTLTLSNRLTYAHAPLTQAMKSASRIVVTSR
jgi:hypothetical protein